MVFPEIILEDDLMTDPTDIQCSDDLFRSLIEASHCSFILLTLRRLDRPVDIYDIANFLTLELLAADELIDTLIHFGFVIPVGSGDKFIITPSGIDLISPKPLNSPWAFDPALPYDGDRLPTYVAFDLLPLRIWSYHRSLSSKNN
jgi:hypothetical protein